VHNYQIDGITSILSNLDDFFLQNCQITKKSIQIDHDNTFDIFDVYYAHLGDYNMVNEAISNATHSIVDFQGELLVFRRSRTLHSSLVNIQSADRNFADEVLDQSVNFNLSTNIDLTISQVFDSLGRMKRIELFIEHGQPSILILLYIYK
jgi:hypothetical protein